MTDWRVHAVCGRSEDADLWFSDAPADIAAAKAICERCPSRNPCAVAGRDEPWGCWGGLETGERIGVMLLATPEPAPHVASRGAYVQGCRCEGCTDANRLWIAAYRHRDRPVTEERIVNPWEQLQLAEESA